MPTAKSSQSAVAWHDLDTQFIPAQWQPAALLDLMQMRGVDSNRLLKGTPLFSDQINAPGKTLSARQFLRIVMNAEKALTDPELSFLLGQRLFPGHYSELSAVLIYASNLHQAAEALSQFSAQLCPLWQVVIRNKGALYELVWESEFEVGNGSPFLTEAFLGGWLSCCNWLADDDLPWQLHVTYSAPRHIEQYELHLKHVDIRFDSVETKLVVPENYLFKPWPRASALSFQSNYAACLERPTHSTRGFIGVVRQCVREHLCKPPSLPTVANELGMSNATLKRHLSKHGTNFQKLLDEVRTVSALHLLRDENLSNDQIAKKLRFSNVANFRRAFKRWTGATPTEMRDGCLGSVVKERY